MNKKEQEVIKTMNNIIKNKNKNVSTYSMNKLKKLTKGGGITNLTNSSFLSKLVGSPPGPKHRVRKKEDRSRTG